MLQALTLPSVEITDVRSEVHYDAEAEGEYRSTSPWQYSSTGNSYRQSKRSPTARHVSRVQRAVDSGSGAPVADRQADPTTTSEGSKSRTPLCDQLRRPYRFQPLSDRVQSCASHTTDSTVGSTTAACSEVVIATPLLHCSARCLLVTFTVLCASSSVVSFF